MSKTAIKTGRYTHELRSKNILEVKRLQKQNSDDGSDEIVTSENPIQVTNDDVKYLEYESVLKKKVIYEETLQMLMEGQTHLYEHLDDYYDEKLMHRRQLAVYVSILMSITTNVCTVEITC